MSRNIGCKGKLFILYFTDLLLAVITSEIEAKVYFPVRLRLHF